MKFVTFDTQGGILNPSSGDAGYDLYTVPPKLLAQGVIYTLYTEIGVEIPHGYVGLIKSRSSFAARGGVVLGGVVDSSYRGEVKVLVTNLSAEPIEFVDDSPVRLAQLVVIPCYTGVLEEVMELSPTARGHNGFGSTGE